MLRAVKKQDTAHKKGFTIIEVMLVLAVAGMLLVAVLGGAYSNIATQRFNDSLRSFAEFLRQNYSEVISPESLGSAEENDINVGYSQEQAIYGKVLVFGLNDETKVSRSDEPDTVYSVTLVGDVTPPKESKGFIVDLFKANAHLYCGENAERVSVSTVSSYNPAWQTKIMSAKTDSGAPGGQFQGMIIIARSPTSGVVHTAYSKIQPKINEYCTVDDNSANVVFKDALKVEAEGTEKTFDTVNDISFCLKSESSRLLREVHLIADGHNTSAVTILDVNDSEGQCY